MPRRPRRRSHRFLLGVRQFWASPNCTDFERRWRRDGAGPRGGQMSGPAPMHNATPLPDDDDAEAPRGEGARMFDVLNALRSLPAGTLDPTGRHVLLVLVSHMNPKPRPGEEATSMERLPKRLAARARNRPIAQHRARRAGSRRRCGPHRASWEGEGHSAPSERGRDPESDPLRAKRAFFNEARRGRKGRAEAIPRR